MKLHEYSVLFAELFDSYDAIAEYEPQKNDNGQYIDDDGNIIDDIDSYKQDMQTAWLDTLEAIESDFDTKAENIACYIGQLEGELAMLERKKAAFERRCKAKANQINRLRAYLLRCMQTIGRKEITTDNIKITLHNNPESVQFANEKAFIEWAKGNDSSFLNYGKPTISRTAVKNALKSGKAVPGALLGRTQSLKIE